LVTSLPDSGFGSAPQIIGGVFRCYAVVFSVFVAVLETEWAPVIRLWKVVAPSRRRRRFASVG
jgi:hypothetical protein